MVFFTATCPCKEWLKRGIMFFVKLEQGILLPNRTAWGRDRGQDGVNKRNLRTKCRKQIQRSQTCQVWGWGAVTSKQKQLRINKTINLHISWYLQCTLETRSFVMPGLVVSFTGQKWTALFKLAFPCRWRESNWNPSRLAFYRLSGFAAMGWVALVRN